MFKVQKDGANTVKATESAPPRSLIAVEAPRSWRACLAFGGIFTALFLLFQFLNMPQALLEGKIYLLDPDSYTWLDRAARVMNEPGIYVHEDPLDNYPHGFATHWTQPLHW